MSTLSEIAANHAKAAKTLDAESAMLKALCSHTSTIGGMTTADVEQQVPPHTIAAINNSLSGHIMGARADGGVHHCGQ